MTKQRWENTKIKKKKLEEKKQKDIRKKKGSDREKKSWKTMQQLPTSSLAYRLDNSSGNSGFNN